MEEWKKERGGREREEREKASKDEKKQARMDAQQRTNRELNWGLFRFRIIEDYGWSLLYGRCGGTSREGCIEVNFFQDDSNC